MRFESHPKEGILLAFANDEQIFELDTDTSGEDDMLIGSRSECLADVLYHFEISELPKNWELRQVKSVDEIY